MFENLCAKILKMNKRFLRYCCGFLTIFAKILVRFARNTAMSMVHDSIGMALPKERKEKTCRESKVNDYTFFE